jgi:hypothetical protein
MRTVIMLVKKPTIKLKITATVLIIVIVFVPATACNNNDSATSQPHIPQGDMELGAPLERVPDLLGYSLEALTREFENFGFVPMLVMLISNEPKDTVLFIEKMGQLIPVPSNIEVHISAGLPNWDTNTSVVSEPSAQQQGFKKMVFGGISWLVLEEKEDKLLLLSELVLFDRPYNDEYVSTTWETCTLRSYLNNEFFNSFSPEERERIAETRVSNGEIIYTNPFLSETWPVPGGNDTDDRIFLLSQDEQRRYFANDSERMAHMSNDHWAYGTTGYDHWWWRLRSPGECTFQTSVIGTEGNEYVSIYVDADVGVRPALWIYNQQ